MMSQELYDAINGWSAFYMRHKVWYGAPTWPSYSYWMVEPKDFDNLIDRLLGENQ